MLNLYKSYAPGNKKNTFRDLRKVLKIKFRLNNIPGFQI